LEGHGEAEEEVKVWVLGSGSRGNAVVVESGECRVLIDVGFGPRTLSKRMKALGLDPRSIEACIITHEHSDHARGAARAQKKWNWPVFATTGTALNLRDSGLVTRDSALNVTQFRAGDKLSFSDLEVETFRTPHDATEPVGMALTAKSTGARAAVVTDLGMVTASVRRMVQDVDLLVIESNHDEDMLRGGPYPEWLQKRVASSVGHLSNKDCADLVSEAMSPRLRTVVLAHISEENNTPRLAFETMKEKVKRTAFRGLLGPAGQDTPVGPFTVGLTQPRQLSLEL
jgi:phosphoribosyl 1,2-cyclic phosphodiesterase